jgi:hypothetical protein
MSCKRCNRRKPIESRIQIDKLLNVLEKGLCKLTTKMVNENNTREIYCTQDQNFTPSKGSPNYRASDTVESVKRNKSILVWASDKTLNSKEKKESGWLKIKIDQILNYSFVGEIPNN